MDEDLRALERAVAREPDDVEAVSRLERARRRTRQVLEAVQPNAPTNDELARLLVDRALVPARYLWALMRDPTERYHVGFPWHRSVLLYCQHETREGYDAQTAALAEDGNEQTRTFREVELREERRGQERALRDPAEPIPEGWELRPFLESPDHRLIRRTFSVWLPVRACSCGRVHVGLPA